MSPKARVLLVDDKPSFRFLLEGYLGQAGYEVTSVADGAEAAHAFERGRFELVLSDMVMPKLDGMGLLREVRKRQPRVPFVLLTGHGSLDTAVAALREGADDYLVKPPNRDELLVVIDRLIETARLRVSSERRMEVDRERFSFQNLTSKSPRMSQTLAAANTVSASPRTTVSLYGESGVGKEVLARAIHLAGGQDLTNFVAVNCTAIPEALLESELFGHVKGAFTGADHEREGKCSRAEGGTLFLDEIGDLPLSLQPKLLRLLEERVYEKVGGDRPRAADFRIIVATHRDLEARCAEGSFRLDLFHRLNVFPITIPPLRERLEDLPELVERFLGTFGRRQGKPAPSVSAEAMALLLSSEWPGNIRELRNRLEYATLVAPAGVIGPEHLRVHPAGHSPRTSPPRPVAPGRISLHLDFSREEFSLEAVTRRVLEWALEQSANNKSSAARLLKASRKLFY